MEGNVETELFEEVSVEQGNSLVWLSNSGIQNHAGGNAVLRAFEEKRLKQEATISYLSLGEFSERLCSLKH